MKNKTVAALLLSMAMTASTVGGAAVVQADMPAVSMNAQNQGMPGGEMGGPGSERREIPGGSFDGPDGGEMNQIPDGQMQAPPERPEGSDDQMSGKQTPPEKPEGSDDQNNGQQAVDGVTSPTVTDDNQMPGMPENTDTQDNEQQTPQKKQARIKRQNNSTNNGQQTPPEKPEGTDDQSGSQNNSQQTPPAMPGSSDDQSGSRNNSQQTPPAMPGSTNGENGTQSGEGQITDGQMPDGQMPGGQTSDGQMPDGQTSDGQMPGGQMPGGQMPGGQPGGGASQPTEYTAANSLDADSTDQNYDSSAGGESAVLVDGKDVTISGSTVNKTGDSNGEDSDFYGTNAAVLAVNGGSLTISDADISTNGSHANAVFSYGTGTSVSISDSTITTTGNNSGGLMTTGGGTMTATNLTVNTSGNSSAAIRTDRGGGTVTVSGGAYNTAGTGSPAIYSTADITVSDAELSATNSEAVVIEGGNSVTLKSVNITGNDATLNGQSTVKTNVLIYQSMSGDASEGTSSFSMTGGTMTSETGSMFHVTNTTATIDLSGVDFTYASDSEDFIIISEDSWGKSGSNGGHVTMNLDSQEAEGNTVVDKSSDLSLSLSNTSSYTGAINSSNSGAEISVTIDSGSTWTLTGDSYITSFNGDISSVNTNGFHLYVNGTMIA